MYHLDLDVFYEELSDRAVSLLPDGTTCYAARYFGSKNQFWYATTVFAVTPGLVVMLVLGNPIVRSVSMSLCAAFTSVFLVWHGLRYRKYIQEVRAGCHMQGVFLFRQTRDIVVRFHRAIGDDIEASFSRDTILAVSVQRHCCTDCLVIDSAGTGSSSKIYIPASWLVDPVDVIAKDIDAIFEVSHFMDV